MAYQSNGIDALLQCVPKDYLLDIYPSLSNLVNSPTLFVWGDNSYGEVGDNTTTWRSSPVQTIAGGANWKQVSCGFNHISMIKTDGTLWTCGYNNVGQLGTNNNTMRSSPVQTIIGGNNWSQVVCGYKSTIAIKTDGTLWGCGYNNYGQLGDNSTTHRSSPVQTISGGTNWKMVSSPSSGGRTVAAIKADGTLWCWGEGGYGQLGDNTSTSKSSPVQTISATTNWKKVACGGGHTTAIKTDGTLWCWGFNNNGQLGTNTITWSSSPVQTITGGSNWKQVSAGIYHTAAIKTDGTLWSWGLNDWGRLGTNDTQRRSSPVQTVAGGNNWKFVSCGQYNSSAIKTDGTLWSWGNNGWGQLGDNSIIHKSSPVQTISLGTNWVQVSSGGGGHIAGILDNPSSL